MERKTLMDLVFYSVTSKELREQQLLNIFNVSSLDEIPTEELLKFCNEHYCTKGE